jgi:hypothetical protein
MCISPVYALGNETPYFTNMNGVELTKEQYNNLLKGFSHDTINTMSEEMIDFLKDDTNIQKVSTTKYVKVSTKYVNNEAVSTSEEEVSKAEFDNSPKESIITKSLITPMFAASDYVETDYKKITLDVTFGASISTKYVTLTNVWKQIPATKSFDVLAISVGVPSISFNFNGQRSGYQKWDGNTINYDASSGNWKIVDSSTIWKKGLGLSQNIVDATTTSLSNSITVVFLSGALPFPVRASYQHATSSVTLAQSHDYTLGTDGMGGLIKFSSSVWSKYDNTPGLYAELNI